MNQEIYYLILIFIITMIINQSENKVLYGFPSFDVYIQEFNKVYNQMEYIIRKKNFEQKIQLLRAKDCESCDVDNFTDWTQSEYKITYPTNLSNKSTRILQSTNQTSNKSNPLSFNWVDLKKVTTPKNRYIWGDYTNQETKWLFATTDFLESFLIINQQSVWLNLPERYLHQHQSKNLSNSSNNSDHKGYPSQALQFVFKNGIPERQSYCDGPIVIPSQCFVPTIRFTSQNHLIQYNKVTSIGFIQQLVLRQPIIIAVFGVQTWSYPALIKRTLQCTSSQISYVILVGYTQTQWIIKNSLGKSWGLNGYAYISKDPWSNCGIGSEIITTGQPSSNCSVKNCQICVDANNCAQCTTGYFDHYIKGFHTCQLCSLLTNNCAQCLNQNGNCSLCDDGYFLMFSSKTCVLSNGTGCLFKKNQTACVRCKTNYLLLPDGTCNLKNSSSIQCLYPYQGINCTAIICPYAMRFDGYECSCQEALFRKYNYSDCQPCSDNCIECVNATTCLKCQETYYLQSTNKTCIKGNLSCLKYWNNTSCNQCKDNYVRGNNQCTFIYKSFVLSTLYSCPPNCLKCNYSLQCIVCSHSYVQILGLCYKCPQNCRDCDLQGGSILCRECLEGSMGSFIGTRIFNKICTKCTDANCLHCKYMPQICIQCVNGYRLQGYICTKGDVQNCQTYNAQNCTKCYQGFALLLAGQCLHCMPGCSTCTQNNLYSCTNCVDGFYMNNGTCKKCPNQCLFCSSNQKCSQCIQDYYLKNNTCIIKCTDENCYQCSKNANICEKCIQSYILSSLMTCKQYLSCTPCSSCPSFYYLKEHIACTACPSLTQNCMECSIFNPSTCTSCISSYFLNSSNLCQACNSTCLKCQGKFHCRQCKRNYYLRSDRQCEQCDHSCKTCHTRANKCITCYDAYVINQNSMCIFKDKINIKLSLYMDYEISKLHIVGFINEVFSLLKINNTRYFQIQKIYPGSTIVQAYIVPQNGIITQNFLSQISTFLQVGTTINGISIIQSSISLVGDKVTPNDNANNVTNSTGNSIQASLSSLEAKWILIICFGCLIVFIIVVIIFCRRFRLRYWKQKSQRTVDKYCCTTVHKLTKNCWTKEQLNDPIKYNRCLANNESCLAYSELNIILSNIQLKVKQQILHSQVI